MYTSIVVLALTGSGAAPGTPAWTAPSWQEDYRAARVQGSRERRPLAVFVGQGASGWEQVSTTSRLSAEARKALAKHYVPVYVDTAQPKGRQLANELGLKKGLVLSTPDGLGQAFRHEGRLSTGTLEKSLRKYADPTRAVVRTETLPRAVRVVARPRAVQSAPARPAMSMPMMNFGGFSGGFGGGGGGC